MVRSSGLMAAGGVADGGPGPALRAGDDSQGLEGRAQGSEVDAQGSEGEA